ncbi:SDR family NAD(P)-dependent oxidoreductase [Noviherbaspirillum pedocola]|uniref:SDR family oxidoreductase n=1 Tax=Noviherbaspirillum pedocola TaxID=2801341 RepID=A0A934W6F9_9BURK|nr:SDR family oxidoreductase [Noviherbaspirillum pedocola]MBK4735070.1 SDR family oxidoreductase [Noviherbaspirillum pedocola]
MTFAANILDGKSALVTGGTQGIGAAIARQLAAMGASVIAAGLLPAGESGMPEATDDGKVVMKQLDVSRPDSVETLFGDIETLDIVINAAGIIRRGAEHEVEVFEQVLAVNLTGTMRVCAAARPLLAQRGGCIVNLASMLSFFGGGLVPGYSASKGGIAQLTKSLALAYAAEGIRVNAVAPGWIATPLTQALQDDEQRSRSLLERTPLGRWGQPEDVAQVAAFLCTPAASFMTGAVVPVDGGYLVA